MMDASATCQARWGKAVSPWRSVSTEDWQNWRWQLKHRLRTPEQLAVLLGWDEAQTSTIRALQERFHFAVTPYYFSLIDREEPTDPIRRLIVPSVEENTDEGLVDPLSEQADQVAPGLIHRYPDSSSL